MDPPISSLGESLVPHIDEKGVAVVSASSAFVAPLALTSDSTKSDPEPPPKLYDFQFPDPTVAIVFRGICRADIPEVKFLHDELFPIKYSDGFYRELLGDDYITVLAFAIEEKTAKLVGVATGRSQDRHSGCRRINEGYISTLGVSPSWRRKGLGKFILFVIAELLRRERKCEIISLHVEATNQAAIQMYQRGGYVVTERLHNHYHFGGSYHDALAMIKTAGSQTSKKQFCTLL